MKSSGGCPEISKLLSKEARVDENVKNPIFPRGRRHIFISSKSNMLGQALYIGKRIDRLLHRYYLSRKQSSADPGELWLHGLGSQAIERAIQVALHLEHHMYPGYLATEVEIGSCSTVSQYISMTADGLTNLTEKDRLKSAVHIKLRLLPHLAQTNRPDTTPAQS